MMRYYCSYQHRQDALTEFCVFDLSSRWIHLLKFAKRSVSHLCLDPANEPCKKRGRSLTTVSTKVHHVMNKGFDEAFMGWGDKIVTISSPVWCYLHKVEWSGRAIGMRPRSQRVSSCVKMLQTVILRQIWAHSRKINPSPSGVPAVLEHLQQGVLYWK